VHVCVCCLQSCLFKSTRSDSQVRTQHVSPVLPAICWWYRFQKGLAFAPLFVTNIDYTDRICLITLLITLGKPASILLLIFCVAFDLTVMCLSEVVFLLHSNCEWLPIYHRGGQKQGDHFCRIPRSLRSFDSCLEKENWPMIREFEGETSCTVLPEPWGP